MKTHCIVPSRRRFMAGAVAASSAALSGPALAQAPLGLDALARARGMRFGAAMAHDELDDASVAAVIKSQCSVLTAENEFKWKHIEPREGRYRFQPADDIARFASDNDMLLRGHTLVWSQDNRVPDWLLAKEADLGQGAASRMADLMGVHIQAMTARFPGVASWDAVNEAVQLSDGQLRSSVYTRTLGPQFIDLAFGLAREAAPQAQMVYNDYMSWDAKSDHRDGVLRMLEGALNRGVKIDALGIQSHLGTTLNRPRDEAAWRRFLETVEGFGLDILITELDCGDRNILEGDIALRDARVAAFTKGYLDLTLSFERVKQVVLWGVSDRDSYVNEPAYPEARRRPDGLPQRAHPYDDAIRPKPLREAIARALAAAPARG